MLRTNTILGFMNQASTRLRVQTLDLRIENDSRVWTPIRRNLVNINKKVRVQIPRLSFNRYEVRLKGNDTKLL